MKYRLMFVAGGALTGLLLLRYNDVKTSRRQYLRDAADTIMDWLRQATVHGGIVYFPEESVARVIRETLGRPRLSGRRIAVFLAALASRLYHAAEGEGTHPLRDHRSSDFLKRFEEGLAEEIALGRRHRA